MGVLKKNNVIGIEDALIAAQKVAFKAGGEAVRQAFAPAAGRALRNGNGEVMNIFNEVKRVLNKM